MLGREAERHLLPLAAEEIDQDAAARQRARHLLEDHAGRVLVMQDDLGGHADVLLPGQALDLADFAELAGLLDPFAQIGIGDVRRQRRRVRAAPGVPMTLLMYSDC